MHFSSNIKFLRIRNEWTQDIMATKLGISRSTLAGYKNGYADPDFLKKLSTFQLPILFNDRKYRMFQISGDSMLPIPDKSWVIGEYVENFYDIKDGQPYILLTLDEGIIFKMTYNQL